MNLLNIEVMQYGVRRKRAGNKINDNKKLKFRLLQGIFVIKHSKHYRTDYKRYTWSNISQSIGSSNSVTGFDVQVLSSNKVGTSI